MKEVALITGASSGIGKELAKIHASYKRDLVLVARRENLLNELKETLVKEYQIEVVIIVKDLSKEKAAFEIYNEIEGKNIEITYLINNAGFGGHGLFYKRDIEDETNMINVNVLTLTKLTSLFLKDFIKRDKGKILNISSVAALMPGPMQAVYFATKSYVRSFSYALTQEIKNTNVTVTAALPGGTKTEFEKVSKMNNTHFDFSYSPQKVAQDAYKAMEKGRREILTGVTLLQRISFKLVPFVPTAILLKVVYKVQSKK